MRKRRKKFDLPKEFRVPNGLNASEVDQAIVLYNKKKEENNIEGDNVKLWKYAVKVIMSLDIIQGIVKGK